ncbi:N-acetyltransferase [Novosphingobium marinum]|uniref:RimJ/RimL family protein N-acetyltransferase n=1 Tax=Novosphingobium marinum TaxID=1514948 RepID=A0A7Y9XW77_9SPHN|nr:GNAT family N-acetyltransferase [Novosphingobium marinum]NYH95667.1 RimJ/RimL family protein N-acetyltransferase [Novosphingobium marinum]GGC28891.1 N-acetyltransferase [Novosphingobium marinum]
MPEFRLETPRLVLRDWREGDLDAFALHANTPAVMRWLGGPLDAEGLENLSARVIGWQQRFGHTFWLVERRADGGHLAGEVLGFCGLKRADAPGSTIPGEFEIGWRLREDAWGQGYAREAAEASLDAAFENFGAREVFALTVIGNRPSWTLMERLGMRRRMELDYFDDRHSDELGSALVWSIDVSARTERAA